MAAPAATVVGSRRMWSSMNSGDSANWPFTMHAAGTTEVTSCFSPLRSSSRSTTLAAADAVTAHPMSAKPGVTAEVIKVVISEEEHRRHEQHERQLVVEKQVAKELILEANSPFDLLERAEVFIREDWLGHIDELPGDIFTIAAFGDLTNHRLACDFDSLKAVVRFIGCVCICVIQSLGGPVVFLSGTSGWGLFPDQEYAWHAWQSENPLADWEQWSKKLMGLLFLFCFILNGIFVILEERAAWLRIYRVLEFLDDGTPHFHFRTRAFLWISAFLDCWNVLWCSLACYVVVGSSGTPKDVLMDSFGMLFLYNLEKVGSSLQFVDADDWPGHRLGWIYAEWIHKNVKSRDTITPQTPSSSKSISSRGTSMVKTIGSSMLDDVDEERLGLGQQVGLLGYAFTVSILAGMLVVLPVIFVFTPFRLIVPDLIEKG